MEKIKEGSYYYVFKEMSSLCAGRPWPMSIKFRSVQVPVLHTNHLGGWGYPSKVKIYQSDKANIIII